MDICKYYVNNKCTRSDCKFKHIDNICRNHFFNECENSNCKFNHNFKLNDNNKIKNTEPFIPYNIEQTIQIRFNEPLYSGNEICIVNNLFNNNNIYNKLQTEISSVVYKSYCPTFNFIIKQLCSYFCMTLSSTRLNYYVDEHDWKPYHHDIAALKPPKTQNITVGASFGTTREISFESTHRNNKERIRINFPPKINPVYAFGNQVNIDFKHGIPQIKKGIDKNINTGRISVIIFGYSSLL